VVLPSTLSSKCRDAIAKAAAYIRGRQSPSGGFCFYRYGPIEEPSLGDTYYAVSSLKLFGIEVPSPRQVARFVGESRIFGVTYLYFCAFTLDRLGLASRVGAEALQQIDALSIRLPQEGRETAWTRLIDRSGWLESARKTLRLQRRFGRFGPEQARGRTPADDYCVSATRIAVEGRRYAHAAQFIREVLARGEFGVRANLWDTYLALAVAALLAIELTAETTSFVDSLQQPPFGFLMTAHSTMPNLDVVYAGVRCCRLLNLPIRHEREVSEFLLACQTTDGGFSHAPAALPNLEFTYRALQTLALLAPELTHGE